MVIPVTTHEGQPALIVSPAGVVSLAQQGYRVEVRVFAQQMTAGGQIVQQQQQQQQPQIPPPERRFGLTDFVSLFRRRLGQQLWLMCKLAFMVGIFSSNNASWRRILGLCIAAAGIFCNIPLPSRNGLTCVVWQTGELERWARRFRTTLVQLPQQAIGHIPSNAIPTQPQPETEPPQQQEGPMAVLLLDYDLLSKYLFVFVASLWPNAVGGGGGINPVPIEMVNAAPRPPPLPQQQQEQRRDNGGDDSGDEDGPDGGQERVDVVVQ